MPGQLQPLHNLGGGVRWVVGVLPPEERHEFRRRLAQRAVQMQRAPKDDMFGDASRRAQTRQKPSLQLCGGERRDGALEGLLIVVPTFEGTRLSECCSCHGCSSLWFLRLVWRI